MQGKNKLAALVLLALLFSGCASIAGKTTTQLWGGSPIDWRADALVLGMLMVFLAALAYMIGFGMNIGGLKTWGKNELYQALATFMIVLVLVFMLTSIDEALKGDLCPQAQVGCQVELAKSYASVMYSNLREMNKQILQTSSSFLIFQSMTPFFEQLTPPWTVIQFTPFASFAIITDSLNTSFDVIIKVMLLMKSLEIFFDLIQTTLFPSLLVIGIVTRSVYFTRKLGGLLIGIAIGLYFVFPMVYLLAHAILGGTTVQSYVVLLNSGQLEKFSLSTNAQGETTPYEKDAATGKTQPMKQGGLLTSVKDTLNPDEPEGKSWLLGKGGVLDKTGRILVYATFVPFISLITTISFIKILSQNLGGDIEIAGLTRLI